MYVSQEDANSALYRNDCGSACVRGLLLYAGLPSPTVNQLSAETSLAQVDNGLYTYQLRDLAAKHGLTLHLRNDLTEQVIQSEIDRGFPVLLLINYGQVLKRQNQADRAGHFVNVTGYNGNGYYWNDPDFWGVRAREGENFFVPRDQFEKAIRLSVAPYQGLTFS